MRLLPALLLTALAGLPGTVAAEALVVNPKTQCESLSTEQVQNILLGRTTLWPDGTRVVLVLNPDSAFMAGILKTYARKTPSQFDAWWKRQVFTGTGSMPPTAPTLEDLLKQVADTPGAVAFITDQQVTEQVKAVRLK